MFFFFQAEDGIRDYKVTGVQTCALPISDLYFAGSSAGVFSPQFSVFGSQFLVVSFLRTFLGAEFSVSRLSWQSCFCFTEHRSPKTEHWKEKSPRKPDRSSCRGPKLQRNRDYFRTASLNAFDGRRRTTVFALILIASPVCGLRPMRALRCAFTTRPIPGITNLPAAPLASFTASLNSSSKKRAAVFFAVPTFSAMCPTTLVLLSGLAAI